MPIFYKLCGMEERDTLLHAAMSNVVAFIILRSGLNGTTRIVSLRIQTIPWDN